ncbi:unnamed protein product, partial [Ectocarpus sp. 12 AP-2014]
HADALCAREGFAAVSHDARAADVAARRRRAAAAADLALQSEIAQQTAAVAATAVSRLQLLERRASDAGEEVELVRASGELRMETARADVRRSTDALRIAERSLSPTPA